jgi:HPt (histidine-containing phosphotransfer) domain-containing protein
VNEPLDQLMTRLREEYLAEVPTRLGELRSALDAFTAGTVPEGPTLATLFHRLAGSAGAYGFSAVTRVCRETESLLTEETTPTVATRAAIEAAIAAVERAFARGPTE